MLSVGLATQPKLTEGRVARAKMPGYNMFDWNRYSRERHDLAGTKGQFLKVKTDELARHCTEDDAWTAINGLCYCSEIHQVSQSNSRHLECQITLCL